MVLHNIDVKNKNAELYFSDWYPSLDFLAFGICFNVYEDKSKQNIIKIQKFDCHAGQNDEVRHWNQYCLNHQHLDYLPKITKHTTYSFDKKDIVVLECEKLIQVPEPVKDDIKKVFQGYFSKDLSSFIDIDLFTIEERIKSTEHLIKYIQDDFFVFFENMIYSIQQIARYHGSTCFNFDLHYDNVMIRPSTDSLVIVDLFNCSHYEFE